MRLNLSLLVDSSQGEVSSTAHKNRGCWLKLSLGTALFSCPSDYCVITHYSITFSMGQTMDHPGNKFSSGQQPF